MAIKSISQARFDALCFSRRPGTKFFGEEREWYADENENVLGVVILDRTDQDWSYVVLGRDEVARFRAIDQAINYQTDAEARIAAHRKMEEYGLAGETIFPQGLEQKKRKTFLVFDPTAPKDTLHPDFVLLLESKGFSPAKEIIKEIAYTFEDPDGNYIQQFQTDGFDARLWELYLYATLHEMDFEMDRTYKAPDYVCSKFGQTVIIEATTVNPRQQNDAENISALRERELEDYIAVKFGSALYSKLQKRYWEKDHVKGHPFVLAVADLRKSEGGNYSAPFLVQYLYGTRQHEANGSISYSPIKEHTWGKTIPSGFFYQPDAENISAVLFSDSGTISKFNRMGKLAEFGDLSVTMVREGERYATARSEAPEPFRVLVEPGKYKETWAEGVWIFHNPTAKVPLDRVLFHDAAHVYLEERGLVTYLVDAFPTWSVTSIFSAK